MDVEAIKQRAIEEIASAKTSDQLESVRVKYLGRKGELTSILRSLGSLSDNEKRTQGAAANAAREAIEVALAERRGFLMAEGENQEIDLTFPGKRATVGHLHPLTLIENEIKKIFAELNFSVIEGPEVETAHYNFDALNIPESHPARDMWDTFWIKKPELLLRAHTSPMQIRYMETHEPPLQIIVPGRVFRYEAIDAGHEINFHQVEGLMVGPSVSLANFKYIITEFLKQFFGSRVNVRMRPSYFPFVEPGLEIDIQIKGSNRWLEVMGAGMVHPKVFDAVKYNPKFVKGFAFGLGLERMAMLKYNIPDIRMFYENDIRFLKQF